MKQCTTSIHLTRTIHWLEHILSDEDFPAVCAASLLAETLCEIAPMLPEEEQHQIARIVALYALWQLSTQHPPPHEKHELLKTLYLALVKLNRSGIIPSERVRKLGEAIQQLSILPSIRVLNAIEQAIIKARKEYGVALLPDRELRTLQAYFTEERSQKELTEIAGLKSQSGINSLLRRSVHRIWPHVDEAIKQEYPTPEQAFASRASIVTPETRRRMRETPREAWKIEKPRQMRRESIEKKPTGGKGKSREFSEVHKQNLIKANERRNEARQAGTYTGKPLGRPRR